MKRPRASAPPAPSRHTLSYQLREVVDARGLSAYAVGRLAGVDPGVVQRFLTGRRDVLLGTAEKIAAALGLRLVEVARKGRPAGRGPAAAAAPGGDGPAPA